MAHVGSFWIEGSREFLEGVAAKAAASSPSRV